MTSFFRHATFLFLALRAGDLVNLAAGMWLVPKFVAPEELGAVLPVTTFATLLALPVFSFGMAVMKESADLARQGSRGKLKTLWRGVFLAIAILAVLALALMAVFLPDYLVRMRVASAAAGFLILASALLGSVAPVYTDSLQAVRRFGALGAVEIAAAVARFATLAVLMPMRAFAGYFAGNAVQPLVRILASGFALRRELAVRAEPWWTRKNTRRLFLRFVLIAVYLMSAMSVSNVEQALVRESLPAADSAAYYVLTRLSDILNYFTFPLLMVLFPYAAEAGEPGRSTVPLVIRCSIVTLLTAGLLGVVYWLWGRPILMLVPNGANYADRLSVLPLLLAITALTACQTFYTNAQVAVGRFGFLLWFVPMNVAYGAFLKCGAVVPAFGMERLLRIFLAAAVLRFAGAALDAFRFFLTFLKQNKVKYQSLFQVPEKELK